MLPGITGLRRSFHFGTAGLEISEQGERNVMKIANQPQRIRRRVSRFVIDGGRAPRATSPKCASEDLAVQVVVLVLDSGLFVG